MPSGAEFSELGITCHSPHGTGCDMIRFIGERGGFSDADARAIGHWLRDKNAPADPVIVEGPKRPRVRSGAENEREAMNRRYSQGPGRLGQREEQISLRLRFALYVRRALESLEGPWWSALPKTLESWEILRPSQASGPVLAIMP